MEITYNPQIEKIAKLLAPELTSNKSADVKEIRLSKKTNEQLAYCIIATLDGSFTSQAPEQTEGKRHKHWYAEAAMTATSSRLGRFVLGQGNLNWTEKERETKNFRTGYYLLHILVLAGYIDFSKSNKTRSEYRIKCVPGKEKELTDMMEIIDMMEPLVASMSRPMFDKPEPFSHFYHITGGKLVHKCQADVIKDFTTSEMESVFSIVNKNMETPYRVNTELLDVYNESQDDSIFTFDYKVDLTEVQLGGLERERDKVLKIARLVGDRTFYEGAFYDFRGRMYVTNNYLSHAGCKLSKSLFLYDEDAPLGENGWYWLLVHAANCYGFDKAPIEERFEFAEKHLDEWKSIGSDLKNNKSWQQADDPFNFAAAVLEIHKAIESGDKYEFSSGLMVALDATCSGLQILSALSKDRKGAELSNLTNNTVKDKNVKGDYYKMVADYVWKECSDSTDEEKKKAKIINETLLKFKTDISTARDDEDWDALEGLKDEENDWIAKHRSDIYDASNVFWEERKHLGRTVCKRPCMTYFYSCQPKGMALAILEDYQNDADYQGLVYQYAKWLSNRIFEACRSLMPASTALMDLFIRIGLDNSQKNVDFQLDAPLTGFRFRQDYRNDTSKQVIVRYKNKLIKPRVVIGKAVKVDGQKVKQSTSPNVVHMLDSQLVAGMIMRANYPISTIHDSFSSRACDAYELYDDTREVFNIIFDEDDDVLMELLVQTDSVHYLDSEFENGNGRKNNLIIGDYKISEVLDSEFFTC